MRMKYEDKNFRTITYKSAGLLPAISKVILYKFSSPIASEVNVGFMYNFPFLAKLLDLLFVYH